MESFDLRDMVADEVEYRGLDEAVIDQAIKHIKSSDTLLQFLDLIVDEAIRYCCTE